MGKKRDLRPAPPDLALLPLLDRRDMHTINQRHGGWDEARPLVAPA